MTAVCFIIGCMLVVNAYMLILVARSERRRRDAEHELEYNLRALGGNLLSVFTLVCLMRRSDLMEDLDFYEENDEYEMCSVIKKELDNIENVLKDLSNG